MGVREGDQRYGNRLNDHMYAVIEKGDLTHCKTVKWQICVHNEFPKVESILVLATSNNEDVFGEYKQTQAYNKICMDKYTELASLLVTKVSSPDSYDIPVQDKPSSYDTPVQDKPSRRLSTSSYDIPVQDKPS